MGLFALMANSTRGAMASSVAEGGSTGDRMVKSRFVETFTAAANCWPSRLIQSAAGKPVWDSNPDVSSEKILRTWRLVQHRSRLDQRVPADDLESNQVTRCGGRP